MPFSYPILVVGSNALHTECGCLQENGLKQATNAKIEETGRNCCQWTDRLYASCTRGLISSQQRTTRASAQQCDRCTVGAVVGSNERIVLIERPRASPLGENENRKCTITSLQAFSKRIDWERRPRMESSETTAKSSSSKA